jgi:hypothetical protein
MVEAAEFAADEWAVSVTGRPVTLASCLARVAEWSLEDLQFAPAMASRRSSALVRRVRHLTSGTSGQGPSPVAVTLMACALVAAGGFMPRVAIGGGMAQRIDAERMIIVRRVSQSHETLTRTFDAEVLTMPGRGPMSGPRAGRVRVGGLIPRS